MKKVMMALPELDVGGAQIMTLNLIREIKKKTPEVQFQILLLESAHGSYLEEQCRKENIDAVYLGKEKGLHPSILPRITKAIKAFGPDVIHMHKSRLHYFLLPILLCGVKKRLYTVHCLADKDTRNKWLRKLMAFAFRCCRVVPVTISDLCRDSLATTYRLDINSISCIYNGIDTEKFKNPEARTAPQKGRLTFIAVGRLSQPKNYPLLLRVAEKVHKSWPDVEIVILGDGELRESVEGQIAQQHSQDYVHLMGNVSDVNHYLWKADAFLMTSDWEGLPLTVLEAMAAGLPIISTRAGGVVDVVENGENGILVSCGDENGLANAIGQLCDSPDLCMSYSQKSRELAQKYSLENMAKAYLQLYMA
ncbi:MAG: glycosyltransferase family 4 protein [Lachnospiraceae bacterium]|nr:glycosyltransferase family 4 protein [Lachnospiraceae bacterium]